MIPLDCAGTSEVQDAGVIPRSSISQEPLKSVAGFKIREVTRAELAFLTDLILWLEDTQLSLYAVALCTTASDNVRDIYGVHTVQFTGC